MIAAKKATASPRTPQVGPDGERRLLSIAEVAAKLGVTEKWVRSKVAARRIPHVKVGGLVRFEPERIDAYIEANRVEVGGGGRP